MSMSIAESRESGPNCLFATRRMLPILLVLMTLALGSVTPAHASASDDDVQTAWRLLDYVAVDYRGAIVAGQIKLAHQQLNQLAKQTSP